MSFKEILWMKQAYAAKHRDVVCMLRVFHSCALEVAVLFENVSFYIFYFSKHTHAHKYGERLGGHAVIAESRWGIENCERLAVIRRRNTPLKLHHCSCIINELCLFLGEILDYKTETHSVQEKMFSLYKK